MAYFSSVTKSAPLLASSVALFQRFSLRNVKGIAVGLLLVISLEILLLWQPAYHQLRSLQTEKTYWEQVLTLGVENPMPPMPSMDQLPGIIEQCRGAFSKEGVDVVSLNVERFGERREIGNVARLDYSLVRLHLRGNWEGIVTSLKALEETTQDTTQNIAIHVQEAVLDADGGETLLQIYFISQ